ncbi:MAG: dTDP-4-dehydrorhamnose 3,5-epimerase, partial [Planctomycetales bacterium]
SRSRRGVLRGLHYQLRHPQGKLVRVVRGEIFDVAVDLRRNSPTFGRWTGTVLSEENHRQLYIPPGFAHGFCVVSEVADVLYKTTDVYHPEDEHTVMWNDSAIGIPWPESAPLISEKDQRGLPLAQAQSYEPNA